MNASTLACNRRAGSAAPLLALMLLQVALVVGALGSVASGAPAPRLDAPADACLCAR